MTNSTCILNSVKKGFISRLQLIPLIGFFFAMTYCLGQDTSLFLIADSEFNTGNFVNAERHYRSICEHHNITQDATLAKAAGRLGLTLLELARYEEAVKYNEMALSIDKRLKGERDRNTIISMNNLANSYHKIAKYPAAKQLYERALQLSLQTLDPQDSLIPMITSSLSNLYLDMGELKDAEINGLKALELTEKSQGPALEVARCFNNLGCIYEEGKKFERAEEYYEKSLALKQQFIGLEDRSTLATMSNLAHLLSMQNRTNEAHKLYVKILSLQKKVLGVQHPDLAHTTNNLACLLKQQGKFAEAEALYHVALSIYEKSFGKSHPTISIVLVNLAELKRSKGNFSHAEELYLKALSINVQYLGKKHNKVALIRSDIASLSAETFRKVKS